MPARARELALGTTRGRLAIKRQTGQEGDEELTTRGTATGPDSRQSQGTVPKTSGGRTELACLLISDLRRQPTKLSTLDDRSKYSPSMGELSLRESIAVVLVEEETGGRKEKGKSHARGVRRGNEPMCALRQSGVAPPVPSPKTHRGEIMRRSQNERGQSGGKHNSRLLRLAYHLGTLSPTCRVHS